MRSRRALRERLRATDLLARISGCEFAILLPEARATQARELAGELVALAARAAGTPAAAGIACFPDGLDRPAGALLADADTALAAAPARRPARRVFDARVFRTARCRRVAGRAAAARARRGDGCCSSARPVIDVHSGATDHHAVVARLRGAADGLLERAERFGLGREIDRRAVEHALAARPRGDSALVVPLAVGAAADRALRGLARRRARRDAARAGGAARARRAGGRGRRPISRRSARSPRGSASSARGSRSTTSAGSARSRCSRRCRSTRSGSSRRSSAALPVSDRDRAVVLALVHAAEALGAETVATGVDGEAELTAVRGFGIRLAQGTAPFLQTPSADF